jgi:beta-glucosidase
MSEFPRDFRWGVATAAYQIEGAVAEDGRGPSIWDTFTADPDRISDGSSGAVACDHYHRYREDVALVRDLGVNSYRFSISWSRVLPDGEEPANPAGIAFYDRLVDELLGAGIDPVATLFHWDLPQGLQDKGGWLSRDTAARFGEYADLIGGKLGDRVRLWITLNEPFIHMTFGHGMGMHAPGQTLLFNMADGANPFGDIGVVAHHLLLGHGLAVAALRRHTTNPIAITNNYSPIWPRSDADAEAAATYDALQNRLFTDPVLGRGYPEGLVPQEVVLDGDLAVIAVPIDALGVNYYNPTSVTTPVAGSPLPFEFVLIEGYPFTEFGWPVVPDGLREMLVTLRDRYGEDLPPIYITENGAAYAALDDQDRITYLDGHIDAVAAARAAGVDVRGYFAWSLMDNFEWAEGYDMRFGLYEVDFATQERRLRKGALAFVRKVKEQP